MENETNILLIVMTGSAVVFILILAILFFVVIYRNKIVEREKEHTLIIKNKELQLLRSIIDTQENEREKIAANLHDEVGPLLSTLKLNLTKHKRSIEKNTLEAEHIENNQIFLDKIIENVRSVSHDLTPHFLLKFGLIKSIQSFINQLPIPDKYFTTNIIEDQLTSKQVKLNIYRVFLELMNNLIKHDPPTNIQVFLEIQNKEIILKISHNGQGITNQEFEVFANNSNGLGLNSMQSRVIILNGKLYFSKNENSAEIKLITPYNNYETN